MKMIPHEHTEHLGFWEVNFDEEIVPYVHYEYGWYRLHWSIDPKYLGISMPETGCRKMFKCNDANTFNKLFEYLDSLERPDNIDQADDAVVELIYWLARNPEFTWKD